MSDDYTPPTPAQVETVVGALDDGTEISIIMRAFYPLLLERAWERAGQQVQLGTAFDLRNPRVQETIAGLAQKVRRVADTTRDDVRRVMALVDADGISYNQAAKLLRGVTETLADGTTVRPFDAPYRAFMIAVTEAAYAYSRGQVLAWQESGEVDRMQWVAETNACAICSALNGEIVTLGAAFGGSREVPAHPNCRCTLSPVLKDEFSMPAAPVSGPVAPVGPRPASFTIKPDGTMDYTPSQYAEDLATVLIDSNSAFRRDLNMRFRSVERLAADIVLNQKNITDATQIMATTGRRTQRHIVARQILANATQELKRSQQDLAAEYADLTTFLTTINPSPAGVGAPRPTTIIDLIMVGGQYPSDETKVRVEARINAAYQIMETFIPPISANGQATHLGFGPTGRAIVGIEPQTRRAAYYVNSRDIRVDQDVEIRTIMHELLHAVEDYNPTMGARIQAWYKTRTAPGQPGAQLEQLSVLTGNNAYSPNEQSRPDQFANYYIGKDYNVTNIGGSEVLSMFADYMISPRTNFIREDPEWVKFCIDVLADPGSYQ